MKARRAGRLAVGILAIGLSACGQEARSGFAPEDIGLNNRGVGLMGYFDYPGARDAFAELVERRPDWLDARVNLAIATLNRQQDGDETAALRILEGVLAEDPGHVRAHYVSGLLRLYVGDTEESAAHFATVLEADPDDAYAAYFMGQNLLQAGRLEETLDYYERAMRLDPYLRSAYYGAALVLRRLNRRDEATAMIEAYERLADNPRARLAEFKYTRMGPRGEALAVGASKRSLPPRPAGDVFGPPRTLATLAVTEPGGGATVGITVADGTADGRLEVLVTGGSGGTLLAAGSEAFDPVPAMPFAETDGIAASAWGDMDNDGLNDLYLCRVGPNQLWRQSAPGVWVDVTESTGTAGDDVPCADAAFVDADHDGDLDIVMANRGAPDELFSNNRDGSFRPLGASQNIAGAGDEGRQVLVADLDNDRDLDLVFLNREPPHRVYLNDRLWRYRPAEDMDEFREQALAAVVAGDVDGDGRRELYGLAESGGIHVWRWDGVAWGGSQLSGPGFPEASALGLQDFDGDGTPELVASGPEGADIVAVESGDVIARTRSDIPLQTGSVPFLRDAGTGPSLTALDKDGRLIEWPPGDGRHRFLSLAFTGKEERADSMRSNRSGIGTHVGVRVADHWAMGEVLDRQSAPGQSLQPLAVGLSGASAADYVAITWSDGVFQTELDVAAGRLHQIPETQRQLSSCPVLFVWNGERWAFASDILGVAGLGFLVEPGRYSTPRPWEYFLLPDGMARPLDGQYALKITEPMEENAYLDRLRLHVFDLPPGWDVLPDERMQTGAPEVTGRPLFYRRTLQPARVHDGAGRDLTIALAAADRAAADPGPLDNRFLGRLARPLSLTLEFDRVINGPGMRPVLAADGWVEYPYSQTVFAAWQAGARYTPPTLEARDEAGVWHRVHEGFGYPAGMPRRMALPLDALPPGTVALRITSNLEIYWDRLAIVYAEDAPDALRASVVEPASARLAKTGFPLRTNRAFRRPDYDYGLRRAFWDTRYLPGFYTALGPVRPLLADEDDAFVIMGPGEEVDVRFAAPPPPAQGWTRRIVLEARGYAKDMDLYTEHGESVGPLPLRFATDPVKTEHRERLDERYQTRYQAGR